MKKLSLRTRIVAVFVLLYGTLFVLLLIWMMLHVQRDFLLEVDEGLARSADELTKIINSGPQAVDSLGALLLRTSSQMALARHISIEQNGRPLYTCTDFPAAALIEEIPSDFRTVRSGEDWFRVHGRRAHDFSFTIAERITATEHTLYESFVLILVSIPLVILISVASGYYLVRRLLRPLDDIMTRARHITSESLNERLPSPGSDDEIDRLVQTLNEMIGRLELSFSQLEQFSANAAHELRTPLTILKGELQIALERDPSAREARAVLESNLEEVERISRTVENLFMLSRIDNKAVDMEFEAVELRTLLEEILHGCEVIAEQKNVSLSLSASEPFIVLGDAVLLMQLFLNLVENAIKYNRKGGSVHVAISADKFAVNVSVSDTGIGLRESELERIFERFYRVNKRLTREQGGAGLGLSLARWIAQIHGGTITVESVYDSGSVFVLSLPHASARN